MQLKIASYSITGLLTLSAVHVHTRHHRLLSCPLLGAPLPPKFERFQRRNARMPTNQMRSRAVPANDRGWHPAPFCGTIKLEMAQMPSNQVRALTMQVISEYSSHLIGQQIVKLSGHLETMHTSPMSETTSMILSMMTLSLQ